MDKRAVTMVTEDNYGLDIDISISFLTVIEKFQENTQKANA